MLNTRRDTEPATPTFSQDNDVAGTSQDGNAVSFHDNATPGSPLSVYRQYRQTIADLRSAANAVERAGRRAIGRACELAEAVEQDELPRAAWVVQRFDTPPSQMGFVVGHDVIGRPRESTLAADIDDLATATAALASAVYDICEIAQLGV